MGTHKCSRLICIITIAVNIQEWTLKNSTDQCVHHKLDVPHCQSQSGVFINKKYVQNILCYLNLLPDVCYLNGTTLMILSKVYNYSSILAKSSYN